ncbi:MAG: DUF1963 domain-containing protein [Kofleriaceae bacterium]
MNKQAFVKDGRFVELNWTKRAIEITEGEIGTVGESLDEVMTSEDEVRYRIDREVARLRSAGFVEGDSKRLTEEEAAWQQVNALARPIAIPSYANEPGDPAGSRAGGTPWLTPGAPHPTCERCQLTLQLIVQIDLADVRDVLAIGDGLLQYFACDRSCYYEDIGEPFSCSAVRVIDPAGGALAPIRDDLDEDGNYIDTHVLLNRRITWTRDTDLPSPYVIRERLEIDDDTLEDLRIPARWEKVGGWTCWAQSARTIECANCSVAMEHVLQLEHAVEFAQELGGNIQYIVRCPKCAAMTAYQQH